MTPRRQNSSCDQCRRLKRRCTAQPDLPPGPDQPCFNCFQLGYHCTFKFAMARAEQRQKRTAACTGTSAGQSHVIPHMAGRGSQLSVLGSSSGNRDTRVSFGADIDLSHTASVDLGKHDGFANDRSPLISSQNRVTATPWEPLPDTFASLYRSRIDGKGMSGFWSGSPIQLLTSSCAANQLGALLNDAFQSMMYSMESRYLTYGCNPFSPSRIYCFGEDEREESNIFATPDSPGLGLDSCAQFTILDSSEQNEAYRHQKLPLFDRPSLPNSPKILEPTLTKITFVGLARFLDHFGNLYGNRLSKQNRKDDETALVAVQQTFALQWYPCDSGWTSHKPRLAKDERISVPTTVQNFTSAWYQVRTRMLGNAKSHRSFMSLYAMLVFHMTSAPQGAANAAAEKNDILNQSLLQLLHLKSLVQDYCASLDISATYRTLLESAVKVFEWFAYVKDTMASIVSDRVCILPDAPVESACASLLLISPATVEPSRSLTNDAEVSFVCRNATRVNFRLLRKVVCVKRILRDSILYDVSTLLSEQLDAAVKIIEDFDLTYGPFCAHCERHFSNFSEASQISSGFLILFWALAVLSLVEQIQAAQNLEIITRECEASLRSFEYEKAAISSVVAISKHFVNISTAGNTRVSRDSALFLPFISHHANLAPIVDVLVKTVEHIIRQNMVDQSQFICMEDWFPSLKPLLTCLADLDTTVAGSQTARIALRKLMNSYGDILMDCWHVDEPETQFLAPEVPPELYINSSFLS